MKNFIKSVFLSMAIFSLAACIYALISDLPPDVLQRKLLKMGSMSVVSFIVYYLLIKKTLRGNKQ